MSEPLDLGPIKERERKASPDPWVWSPWDGVCDCSLEREIHSSPDQCPSWYWDEVGQLKGPTFISWGEGDWLADNDLEFVAHARQDVPALIAEVERGRELQDRLSERCELLGRALNVLWALVGEEDQQAIMALPHADALVQVIERRGTINAPEVQP